MGGVKSKSATPATVKRVVEVATKAPGDVPDASFINAINRAGNIRPAEGPGGVGGSETMVKMSNIKPLPKRQASSSGSLSSDDGAKTHLTMEEWFIAATKNDPPIVDAATLVTLTKYYTLIPSKKD